MSKSRRRSLGTSQINMRTMFLFINGSAGVAATAQGFDRYGVTLVRNSAGNYTLNFKTAFLRPVMVFTSSAQATLAGGFTATATTAQSVTIVGAADADIFVMIVGSEFQYDVD